MRLPQGDAAANFSLRVAVHAFDNLGAKSERSAEASLQSAPFVRPADEPSMANLTGAMLASMPREAFAVQRMVQAISSALAEGAAASLTDGRAAREQLLKALQGVAGGTLSAEVGAGLAATLADATAAQAQISEQAVDTGLQVALAIAAAAHIGADEAAMAGLSGSASNLLGGASARHADGVRGIAPASAGAAARGERVAKLVEKIAHVGSGARLAGEAPLRISQPAFALESRRATPAELLSAGGTLGGGGEVQVPTGALQRVAQQGGGAAGVVRAQLVAWSGSGPYFDAGDGMGGAGREGAGGREGAARASSVLSVSFFDDEGGHLDVSGLGAEPIVLSLKRDTRVNATQGAAAERALPVVWCTHWDVRAGAWAVDGLGTLEPESGDMRCAVSHLSAFSTFMGPPPTFNKLSFSRLTELPSPVQPEPFLSRPGLCGAHS